VIVDQGILGEGRGCEVKGVDWLVGWDVSRKGIQAQ